MDVHLTAIFRRVPEGYIAFLEELPGANTQGATLAEGYREHPPGMSAAASAAR